MCAHDLQVNMAFANPGAYICSADPTLSLTTQLQDFMTRWPTSNFVPAYNASGGQNGSHISYYNNGSTLQTNKNRLVTIARGKGLPDNLVSLLLAYAFIETSTLSANDRDKTKDPGGGNYSSVGAINYGLFNINYDMITATGVVNDTVLKPTEPWNSPLNFDTDYGVSTLVDIVLTGMCMWGIDRYVSYVRGGQTLFNDTTDYTSNFSGGFKVMVFKTGLTRTIEAILSDTTLLTDSRRVGLNIPYV